MTGFARRIIDVLVGQRQTAEDRFSALAEAIAAGDEPEPVEAAEVLRDAGRSVEDLDQRVRVLQRRRELREVCQRRPGIEARQRELQAAIRAADGVLAEATMQHGKEVVPLLCELENCEEGLRRIGAAKAEYVSLADPEVKAEVERLRQAAQDAQTAVVEATKTIHGCEAIVQHRERDDYECSTPTTVERLRQAAEALAAAKLDKAEREAAAQEALDEFKKAERETLP